MTTTPQTNITLPLEEFINESFDFSVIFSNAGSTEGYGPYFNLYIPEGITIGSPTYFDQALTSTFAEIGTWDGTKWVDGSGNEVTQHPLGSDVSLPTDGVTGDTLYTIELPFGSFVDTQPEAAIKFTGTLNKPEGAVVGTGLDIRTQGGFRFGADELDNADTDPVIVESSVQSQTITPIVWELTKTSNAPESETATGENFVREFTLTVDIANGETVENITIKDFIPDNLQFVQITSVTAGGSQQVIPSDSTPGGNLEYTFSSVTGTSASNDIVITYEAYVPEFDASNDSVIDPDSGDDEKSINESQATGTYASSNIFTGTTGFNVDDNNGIDDTADQDQTDYTLQDKSIAIQKSVNVIDPLRNNPDSKVVAGTVLKYTLDFQISDYFSFEDVFIDDIFSDGQLFDTSFVPELVVNGNAISLSALAGLNNSNYDVSDPNSNAKGDTELQFRISQELKSRGLSGILQGNEAGSSGTTGTITYRTVIQEDFLKLHTTGDYTGDQSVDLSEVLNGSQDPTTGDIDSSAYQVNIEGTIVSSGQQEADTSSAAIQLDKPTTSKTIYAINGVVVADPNNVKVAPGDLVTYRLTHDMPAADTENLVITDFLPLPIFDVDTLSSSSVTNSGDVSIAGIVYGDQHDLDIVLGTTVNPSVSVNTSQNTISFDFGTFDVAGNTDELSPDATIDLLLTVQVEDKPFADGLFLTNQAEAQYGSTDSNFSAAETEIIPVELIQPVLSITKGVASTTNSDATFSEGEPTVFDDPGNAGNALTSNLTSIDTAEVDNNITGVDAGDLVKFSVVIENTGGRGAYDLLINDTLPDGFELPTGGQGLNLQIFQGNQNSVSFTDADGNAIATADLGNYFFTAGTDGRGIRLADNSNDPALGQGRDAATNTEVTDGSNIIVISYDLQVEDATVAAEVIKATEDLTNTATVAEYAAQEGGTDFTTSLGDLTDTATATVDSPTLEKTLVTTELDDTDDGSFDATDNQATIGELVTYKLVVSLPEGGIDNVSIADSLGSGLSFAELVSITPSSGVTTTTGTGDFSDIASFTPNVSGDDVTFDLGDLSNANRDNNTVETVEIIYKAVVLNESGIDRGDSLGQEAAVLSWTNTNNLTSQDTANAVTVVEPDLAVDKSVVVGGSGTKGDAGDTVEYTITINHSANSGSDAFEVELSDVIPDEILNPVISNASNFNLIGNTLSTSTPFDLVEGETITVTLTGTLATTVDLFQKIRNTAEISWSSLDGSITNRSTDASVTNDDERTGDSSNPGEVHDYTDSDNADIRINSPTLTLNLVDTEIDASNNSDTEAVVGETVEYELVLTIPEGTLTEAAIENTLPEGMGFVSLDSVTLSNSTTLTSDQSLAVGDVLVTPTSTDGNSTQSVNFDLGTLVNSNTTAGTGTPETVTLRYTAVVLNDDINQDGSTLEPSAELQWKADSNANGNLNNRTTDATDSDGNSNAVTVVEPVVTVEKISETNGTTEPNAKGDAGDAAEFTITIQHDSNTPDAFDLTLADVLPENFIYDPATAVVLDTTNTTATGLTSASFEIDGGNDEGSGLKSEGTLQFVSGVDVDLTGGQKIVLKVTGEISSAVAPNDVLDSNAEITWSSLDGTVSDTSTHATNDDERDGSGGDSNTTTLNNYFDSDNAPIQVENVEPIKSIAATSEDHTTVVSDIEQVAIGEIIRYRLVTQLSEGTLNSFQIQDTLPDGLQFLSDTAKLAVVNTDVSNNILFSDTTLNGAIETSQANTFTPTFDLPDANITVSDQTVTFDLSNITNTGTNTGQEFVILEFNAIVENVIGNQAASDDTDKRDNTFDVFIGGNNVATSSASTVEIVEAGVELTQTITTPPSDAGDPVVYEITLTNNGDAEAFDLQLSDILDQHLDLVSVAQSLGSGASITEDTVNDQVTIDISSLDAGESITFEVTATVKDSAPVGYTITNQPEVTYTSLPGEGTTSNATGSTADTAGTTTGERNGTGGVNDYLDNDSDDTTLTAVPTLTAELVSTELDNINNSNTAAVVGELVNYKITLEIPEGTTPDAILSDTLDSGLGFVEFTSITTSSGVTSNLTDVASLNTNATLNSDGFSIDLGDIVNSNNSSGATETIVIEYQAIVLNEAANQSTSNESGPSLNNSVEFNWTGAATPLTDSAADITVIEPKLTVDTTVEVGGDGNEFGSPGETVEYTIVVQHTGDSETDAFDLNLSDIFPTEVEGLTLTSATHSIDGDIASNFSVSGQNLTTPGDVDLAKDDTITLVVTGTLASNATPGELSDTTATKITWTSLDGDISDRSTQVSTGDDERTGDETGNNDYIATDEDKPVVNPEISIDDVSVNEADGTMTFTVSLSNPSSQTVEVDYLSNDGTANAGNDYTAQTPTTLTFAAGETTKTVVVPILQDDIDEPNETYTIDLSNAVNGTIVDNQGVGTIVDDDNPPAISVNDVTVNEADGTMAFTVSLSNPSSETVTVEYDTTDGTAVDGEDYASQTTTLLTFAPGETSQTVVVAIADNDVSEPTETFNLNLSNPSSNATIADNLGIGTITDDEAVPSVSVNDVTVNEADGTATFRISLSGPVSSDVVVDYSTADNSAIAGDDYTTVTDQATITAGDTFVDITVPITSDTIDELNEQFFVNLTNVTSNATISDNQGIGTIVDDDDTPAISVDDVTVDEADGTMTFNVSLSNPSSQTVTVDYGTSDNSAVDSSDYSSQTGTLTFDPGETTQQVTIDITDDDISEPTETFNLNLSNPSNATIADNLGVGTILDDEAVPEVSVNDVTVNEADSTATFRISLTGPVSSDVVVDYSTADNSAIAGSDYDTVNTQATITAGDTFVDITVPITQDNIDELDETFFVNLTNVTSNATIADNQGVGTIVDDDDTPAISVDNVTVDEADGTMTFNVSLSNPSSQTVTVDYGTSDDSAIDSSDYSSQTGTLTFDPGETTQQVTINITDDDISEPTETFNLDLTNPTNATIADNLGVGTITDDETVPEVSIDDVSVNEADGVATFTISLSGEVSSDVVVDYSTADNTAVTAEDYTTVTQPATIVAGNTSVEVTVPITQDNIDELNEEFFVNLTGVTDNATIADNQGVGTIIDDDGEPSIQVDDVTVNEADGTMTFSVSLSNASSETITVDYSTSNDSAVNTSDYSSQTGTLTFNPGDSLTQTITIDITDDDISEPTETFNLNLSNPSNATIGDNLGVGTITDDEAVPTVSVNDVTVNEADGTATFRISLSGEVSSDVVVDYSTGDDSAIAGSDYDTVNTQATITAGDTFVDVTVPITQDNIDELDETFFVNLTGVTDNATIADNQGIGTIVDDDDTPGISVDDVTVNEADGTMTFTVSLSNPSSQTVEVDYLSNDGTADAGDDYTAQTPTTLTFAAGETTKTVVVPILQDDIDEPNETYTIDLSNAVNGTIVDNQGVGTIVDDDNPPAISVNDVTVNEADGTMAFTVSLSNPSSETVTVEYDTTDGTAVDGEDYASQTTTLLTFAPGETSQTVVVAIADNDVSEPTETFNLNLSNPSNATIADNLGVGTILDDEAVPEVSVNDVTVNEADGTATFRISLSGPVSSDVVVDYSTADNSAIADDDYTTVTQQATISAGDTFVDVTVPISQDNIDELDETFFVNLTGVTDNATIADNQGIGTIVDDDDTPAISVDDVTVDEADGTMTFNVSLSNPSSQTVTVDYGTSDNSAVDSSDYSSQTGTLTFDPGETTQQVIIDITDDDISEPIESFNLNLSNPSNATIADNLGVGTITDDEAIPTVSIDDVSVNEADGVATFTISLSGEVSSDVVVDYSTADNTAITGSDYDSVNTQATIVAGSTSVEVTVPITSDTIDELNEEFFVNLTGVTDNATIADNQGIGTIIDDDGEPTILVDDVTVNEADGTMAFTVSLSNPSSDTVTVDYVTNDGTANAGEDYTAQTPTTLTFAAGETTKTVIVPITDDTTDEPDETYTVDLSNATNATISDNQGIGTILDDDDTPAISVDDVTVNEADGTLTFTVSLSNPSSETITVEYDTTDDTAVEAEDYTNQSGTLTFNPGETTQTVTINVTDDNISELTETFNLNLSNPSSNATILDDLGVGTITDNETVPEVSVNDITVNEAEGVATFRISLSDPASEDVVVDYATADNTAVTGEDYTAVTQQATITAGDTFVDVTVPITADNIDETDETFFVNLTGVTSNAAIADNQGIGTILDDDGQPSIQVNDVTVNEDQGTMTFTVSLSNSSSEEIAVDFASSDGTAVAGSDYTSQTGTLNFAAGETEKTVTLDITNDLVEGEPAETLNLDLSNPINATIADNLGIGTILDPATPAVSIDDVSVNEADGVATFTLTLDQPASGDVIIDYETANNTASSSSDYTASAGQVTIPDGSTSIEVTVPITQDTIDEPDEQFFVNLTGISNNATISDNQGVGTIIDDDGVPTLRVDDVTVNENEGTMTFTVSLSNSSSEIISVDYNTSDDSAVDGSDYSSQTGTLTFNPGDSLTQTVTIDISDDDISEPTEIFNLNLSNAVNATIADNLGVGTILDDETVPEVSVNDVTVNEADGTATFTVTLSGSSSEPVTVNALTQAGTAVENQDYTPTTTTLTFAPGETSKTLTVEISDDAINGEDPETFTVQLSDPTNAVINDGEGLGTILDNDQPNLSIDDVTVQEGNLAQFTISLDAPSETDVTVTYTTQDGTATDGDYTSTTATVTIPAGETSVVVEIETAQDSVVNEDPETFTVELSDPINATIADGTGTGTIVDQDQAIISIDDVTVEEGDQATFTISLDTPSAQDVTVTYITSDDTAIEGEDYTPTTATVTIPAGETSVQVSVETLEDTAIAENPENFKVTLSDPVNGVIDKGEGIATITDDDIPSLSINDVTVAELEGQATFTLTLNQPTEEDVTVEYITQNGSAEAGDDYTSTTAIVTIPAGETEVEVTVDITPDDQDETNETFTVELLNASPNVTIADAEGLGTITDSPTISIDDVTVSEAEGKADVTVRLSQPAAEDITVEYTTQPSSAEAGDDYTPTTAIVTIPAGEIEATLTVDIVKDETDETDETFTVNLSNPSPNFVIADEVGEVTITDSPVIRINDVEVLESEGKAFFTVSLSEPTNQDITIEYITQNGSAEEGSDYTALTATVTIPAGETEATIEVEITVDDQDENDETFTVNLSNPNPDLVIADGEGVGTIVDVPRISINDVIVSETTGTASFTLTLSEPSDEPVTVKYTTQNGTATEGEDFTKVVEQEITIPAGETVVTVEIDITPDQLDEEIETFTVNLSDSSPNAVIEDGEGQATITDGSVLSIDDIQIPETEGKAVFTVSLSEPADEDITVEYVTQNGSATEGEDYIPQTGTLTIPAGETRVEVEIEVNLDQLNEADETFSVELSNPSPNLVIAKSVGEATIQDTGVDTDGDGIPDVDDLDDDNDGILDTEDGPGDTDGDGVPDSLDLDSDNDGISDLVESGLTPEEIAELDTDGDGVIDSSNEFGDNGVADGVETTPDSAEVDYDNDGVADNPVDTDNDGQPDFQDLDSDNDGLNDITEAGNPDEDGNGIIDNLTDTDGDGLSDSVDPNNGGNYTTPPDIDNDGAFDYRDLDSDNDGISDLVEGGLDPEVVDPDGNGIIEAEDSDRDGIPDTVDGSDGFSDDGNSDIPDSDNDGTPDYQELDSDNDGTPDRVEAGLPTGVGTPDVDGDGEIDDPTDSDGDGVPNRIDSAPGIEGGFESSDTDGDGIPNVNDLDDDNDGILDELEGDGDTDGDGVPDSIDLDSDNDGIADIVESGLTPEQITELDTDGDGVIDPENEFGENGFVNDIETTPDSGELDLDGDGIANNPVDTDNDGQPDFQDLDSDNDGLNDITEAGNPDEDGNGIIDNLTDTDGDGLSDSVDPNNGGNYTTPPDIDNDGAFDYRDLDSDNDGISDLVEGGLDPEVVDPDGNGIIEAEDSDRDGIPDVVDGSDGFSDQGNSDIPDTDNDGTPDYQELDSDNDGTPDRVEAGLPTGVGTPDVDGDGEIDDPTDSDGDGVPDSIDSAANTNGGFESSNLPPTAINDTATTQVGESITLDVLENDSDPDGNPLSIENFETPSAEGGTVTFVDDELVYTPAAGFTGTDIFTYTLSDGQGGLDTATVTVVVNPTLSDSNSVMAVDDQVNSNFNTEVMIDVLSNDSDPDGDSFELDSFDTVSVNGGTITLVDDQLLYTPAPGFIGDDSFTYNILDSQGNIATATVTVTIDPQGNMETTTECSCFCPPPPEINPIVLPEEPIPTEIIMPPSPIFTAAERNIAENFLLGTFENDSLNGTNVNDEIKAFGGDDYLNGFAGDDNLFGFAGNDRILGAPGNDYISARQNNDLVNAGQDSDTVFGGEQDDTILGELGNDILLGDEGNDTILGGTTNASVEDINGQDQLFGGTGDDFLDGNQANDTLSGGLGDDEIHGGKDDDQLFGDDGNDVIFGELGNDILIGGPSGDQPLGAVGDRDLLIGDTGDDTLSGSLGRDTLHGGIGNDRVHTGQDDDFGLGEVGNDTLFGEQGNDTLLGGTTNDDVEDINGQDLLFGGEGDDFLEGNQGNDTLVSGSGNDDAHGGKDNDLIYGNTGDDTLFGEYGNDTLIGGPSGDQPIGDAGDQDLLFGDWGNDLLGGNLGQDTLHGGEGDDRAHGGKDNDYIYGELGNDTLVGEQGDDFILGGTSNLNTDPVRDLLGEDLIFGEGGNDWMDGNEANDTLVGGDGNDTVYGGQDDDLLHGDAGNDLLIGDRGNDTLCGGDDDDTLRGDQIDNGNSPAVGANGQQDYLSGGAGNDLLFGDEGQDELCGGEGDDTLHGGKDNDLLKGCHGNDLLRGEEGDDTLMGGDGNVTMTGGEGNDAFMLNFNAGSNLITDFQLGQDRLVLGESLTIEQLQVTQAGNNTTISVNNQLLATLEQVNADELTNNSFI